MSDPHMPRDPQEPERRPGTDRDANPYTRYIIAAAAIIVLILAVIVFTGTGDDVAELPDDPAVEEPGATGEIPPADPADDPAAQPETQPETEPAVPAE